MTRVLRRAPAALALAALALAAPASAPAQPVPLHAHRGGPVIDEVPTYPEATLPAFERAARDGFVLELDVKLTEDRVPLVIHDDTLDRTTTCSGPVRDRTAAAIREECRADVLGSPGNAAGHATAPVARPDQPVPTLAEVLALARRTRSRVNIEIKNQPTDNDFDAAPEPAYATTVLDVVDAARIPRAQVLIQSFWPPNLDVAERRGFDTSLLTLAEMNAGGPDVARERGYEWVSPAWPVDQAYVSRAHALGLRVVPYTVDRAADLRAAAAIGVDELIADDPTRAAGVLRDAAPVPAPPPAAPDAAACAAARAHRTLAPIRTLAARPGAPRVFAVQFKQDPRHVVSYAAFRTKIECLLIEWVVPNLAKDRPNVVALTEDVGLATIATGSRGRVARERFAGTDAPSCADQGAPCGAVGALGAIKAAYAKETAAYQARFRDLHPLSGIFVATTDTFARGFMQTFSDLARRYGVYILGSNNQAPFRESTDPAEISQFADPDLPEPPASVFVATEPAVYNEVFLWGPSDVRSSGPAPLRNVVASNKKVPVTPIEEQLDIRPGPRSGPDAIANVAPYALPGTRARIAFATSLPAFVYGALPEGTDPCSDVARFYMRCLDRLGANLVVQDEANPGPWAAYTARDSPDRGAWQTQSWMTSTWRAVTEPSVAFDYNVTPHMVGNLADLAFDGQTAITQRGLLGRSSCAYVGNGSFLEGRDPERFAIGGEDLAVRPFAGPKREFLAMVPWVAPDGPREELERTAQALGPDGDGPLENDYLETAIVADLPFPPEPDRASCATGTVRVARRAAIRLAVTPRRIRAGRRSTLRFRATAGGRPVRGAQLRFAGRRTRTDRRGRARVAVRLHRRGVRVATARRAGLRTGRVRVRVLRPRRG